MMKYRSMLIFFVWVLSSYSGALFASSERQQAIDNIKVQLQKNRSDWWKLSGKIRYHLANKVTNVADRKLIGLGKILGRQMQLNEDLAALDDEKEATFKQWQSENPTKNRTDWRNSGREYAENIRINEKRNKIWSQYIRDQENYRHRVLPGKDGELAGLQRQQDALLDERRRLTEQLKRLEAMTDDAFLRQKAPVTGADPLRLELIGSTMRYVKASEPERVKLVISGGKLPMVLAYRNAKGELTYININRRGQHEVSMNFDSTEQSGMRVFRLEDNDFPRRFQSVTVSFMVIEPDPKDSGKSQAKNKPVPQPNPTKKPGATPVAPSDYDGDGIVDDQDNCPEVFNPSQTDSNTDGIGDACEPTPSDTDGPALPLSVEFTCGKAFELSPNDVLYPKTCYVIVRNASITSEKVKLKAVYDEKLLDVTFDDQAEQAKYPENKFLLIIRTLVTAPSTITTLTLVVNHGGQEVIKYIDILILLPEQEPSSGPGIRPPAGVAAGSGGEFCVWRYKSFGDKPKCFNIVTAQCDNSNYAGKTRYELVGSAMTAEEAAFRAFQLSPYKGDAYGCHAAETKPPEINDRDHDGVPDDEDNCPDHPNPYQKNSDNQPAGDACQVPQPDNNDPTNNNDQPPVNPLDEVDCSAYAGMVAVWNESTQSAGCVCTGNEDWSDALQRCASVMDDQIANTDCRAYGAHALAQWDPGSQQVMCGCATGYEFDANDQCVAANSTSPCAAYPGTEWKNNQCQCPGQLEWSDSLGQCVPVADLTSADINCTSYPGTAPGWDAGQNQWRCQCVGSKRWSDVLGACAYPEDEQVAATDCSSYPNTTAEFDAFSGGIVCRCNQAGMVLSKSKGQCMPPEAAAVADHDCSTFGIGAQAMIDAVNRVPRCACVNGYHMNTSGTACLADGVSGPTAVAGQVPTTPPKVVKDGTCDALTVAGGDAAERHRFDMVGKSQLSLTYNTKRIKDYVRVLNASGNSLWESGCVGTRGNATQVINLPAGTQEIFIDIHPNCAGEKNTSWNFTASCQ